jgi:hypothetical protein
VQFSEKEWSEISGLIPLPEDARIQIGAALAFYKSQRLASTAAPLKTKRSIDKVRRYATKLESELRGILADPSFFQAGQPHWSPRPRPRKVDFEVLFSNLDQLQLTMDTAQSRMKMSPGRKSMQAIDFLIQALGSIQAQKSRDFVQRSTKDANKKWSSGFARSTRFVTLCGNKVGLTPGQIERALKRSIAKYHDTLINHGFNTAIGGYIDGKQQPKSQRSRTASDGHWYIRQDEAMAFVRAAKKKRAK